MIAFAKAMNASITRLRRSVQMLSFLNPRLCQELVRFDHPPFAGLKGHSFLRDHGLAAEFIEEFTGLGGVIAGIEMDGDLVR